MSSTNGAVSDWCVKNGSQCWLLRDPHLLTNGGTQLKFKTNTIDENNICIFAIFVRYNIFIFFVSSKLRFCTDRAESNWKRAELEGAVVNCLTVGWPGEQAEVEKLRDESRTLIPLKYLSDSSPTYRGLCVVCSTRTEQPYSVIICYYWVFTTRYVLD